jgi:hypothetical protein
LTTLYLAGAKSTNILQNQRAVCKMAIFGFIFQMKRRESSA